MTPALPVVAAEPEELVVADAAALRAWLQEHHPSSPGVWLAVGMKGGTTTTLTRQQAVDEALCFGWTDGQARTRDAHTSCVRCTPRRRKSIWSARNVANVARLEAEGRMTDAGRAAVEAAADGRWAAAYASPAQAELPQDLLDAVAQVPEAQAVLDALTKTNRFALGFRVDDAKRPETRQRRTSQFVEVLARHEASFPQERRPS